MTVGLPEQRASNADSVSMSWRHHVRRPPPSCSKQWGDKRHKPVVAIGFHTGHLFYKWFTIELVTFILCKSTFFCYVKMIIHSSPNFAHATMAQMLWHMQNPDWIISNKLNPVAMESNLLRTTATLRGFYSVYFVWSLGETSHQLLHRAIGYHLTDMKDQETAKYLHT